MEEVEEIKSASIFFFHRSFTLTLNFGTQDLVLDRQCLHSASIGFYATTARVRIRVRG